MKMHAQIHGSLFAPCGKNCMACNEYIDGTCCGCLPSDMTRIADCRQCAVKKCTENRGVLYCYLCDEFPCKRINILEEDFVNHYEISLISNSKMVREKGLSYFLEEERERWTCVSCGGAVSSVGGWCSECLEQNTKSVQLEEML